MAASATKTNAPSNDLPEAAALLREQLVSTVRQGQQVALEAAQTWSKAVKAVPTTDLPTVTGVPGLPAAEAVATYAFDVAQDLLTAQREFALQLVSALRPDATS